MSARESFSMYWSPAANDAGNQSDIANRNFAKIANKNLSPLNRGEVFGFIVDQ